MEPLLISPWQFEVYKLIEQGKTLKEIKAILNWEHNAVDSRVKDLKSRGVIQGVAKGVYVTTGMQVAERKVTIGKSLSHIQFTVYQYILEHHSVRGAHTALKMSSCAVAGARRGLERRNLVKKGETEGEYIPVVVPFEELNVRAPKAKVKPVIHEVDANDKSLTRMMNTDFTPEQLAIYRNNPDKSKYELSKMMKISKFSLNWAIIQGIV